MKKKRKLTRAEIRRRNATWALDPEGVKDLILERFPGVRGFVDLELMSDVEKTVEARKIAAAFGAFAADYMGLKPDSDYHGDTARAKEIFSLIETILERATEEARHSFESYFLGGFDLDRDYAIGGLEPLAGPRTYKFLQWHLDPTYIPISCYP